PAQHLHDVTIDREHRRSRQGYATPADARAFLRMAREPKPTTPEAAASLTRNPIVAAYFRAAGEEPEPPHAPAGSPTRAPESLDAVVELLAEAGMMPQRP